MMSGQTKKSSGRKWRTPFYRPAGYVYRHFMAGRKTASVTAVEEAVISLHTGRKRAAVEYQIEKIEQVMCALAVLIVIFAAALIHGLVRDRSVPGGRMK